MQFLGQPDLEMGQVPRDPSNPGSILTLENLFKDCISQIVNAFECLVGE